MKLSEIEKAQLQELNTRQIIQQFPELVIKANLNARSFSDVLRELGIGRTNVSARKSISNFLTVQEIALPDYYSPNAPTNRTAIRKEDILKRFVQNSDYVGTQLRKWVITYNLIPYKCSTYDCLLATTIAWNNKPLTLDLDHINGDNTDNRLANLRFLCPNCHSQTETYKGLNKKKNIKRICSDCGEEKTRGSKLCQKCNGITHRKADYPPIDVLTARVISEGYEGLARELGVSGNAIRKYLKNRLGYAPKRGGANPIT